MRNRRRRIRESQPAQVHRPVTPPLLRSLQCQSFSLGKVTQEAAKQETWLTTQQRLSQEICTVRNQLFSAETRLQCECSSGSDTLENGMLDALIIALNSHSANEFSALKQRLEEEMQTIDGEITSLECETVLKKSEPTSNDELTSEDHEILAQRMDDEMLENGLGQEILKFQIAIEDAQKEVMNAKEKLSQMSGECEITEWDSSDQEIVEYVQTTMPESDIQLRRRLQELLPHKTANDIAHFLQLRHLKQRLKDASKRYYSTLHNARDSLNEQLQRILARMEVERRMDEEEQSERQAQKKQREQQRLHSEQVSEQVRKKNEQDKMVSRQLSALQRKEEAQKRAKFEANRLRLRALAEQHKVKVEQQKQLEEKLKELETEKRKEEIEKRKPHNQQRVEYRRTLLDERAQRKKQEIQRLREAEQSRMDQLNKMREKVQSELKLLENYESGNYLNDTLTFNTQVQHRLEEREMCSDERSFDSHSFSDETLQKDDRYVFAAELSRRGLLNNEYAKQVLRSLPPMKSEPKHLRLSVTD